MHICSLVPTTTTYLVGAEQEVEFARFSVHGQPTNEECANLRTLVPVSGVAVGAAGAGVGLGCMLLLLTNELAKLLVVVAMSFHHVRARLLVVSSCVCSALLSGLS